MDASCMDCLHFKKVPGEMLAFCKMNRLPKFCEISKHEFHENGIIMLDRRKLSSFAEAGPVFVNMDD